MDDGLKFSVPPETVAVPVPPQRNWVFAEPLVVRFATPPDWCRARRRHCKSPAYSACRCPTG